MKPRTGRHNLSREEAEATLRQLAGSGAPEAQPSSPGLPDRPPAIRARPDGARAELGPVAVRLRAAQARYRTLVEQIPAVTFMASLAGGERELYVSPQIETLLGFTQREWLEDPILWYAQLHPDDRERWHKEFARTCSRGDHFRDEYRFRSRQGKVVWVHGEAQVVRDEEGRPLFLQGVAFNITDRKEAEAALRTAHDELERQVRERTAELAGTARKLEAEVAQHRRALAEKELLLKEVHHRVKNNLQIISSLLNLQSGHVQDAHALQVLRETQGRVRAMALVHEKLYQGSDLARIDVGQYIRGLAASLFRSYGAAARGIGLRLHVGDIPFGIDTAVPCGLILNELISNSLKYAFPGGAGGEVRVELAPGAAGRFTLTVADNGVGFPEGLDAGSTASLGLQLVTTLTQQLGGTLGLRNHEGAEVRIAFPA